MGKLGRALLRARRYPPGELSTWRVPGELAPTREGEGRDLISSARGDCNTSKFIFEKTERQTARFRPVSFVLLLFVAFTAYFAMSNTGDNPRRPDDYQTPHPSPDRSMRYRIHSRERRDDENTDYEGDQDSSSSAKRKRSGVTENRLKYPQLWVTI